MSHRVLIVDDEAGIRQALKQVLEYEDLEVRVASSGGEAISLYSEFKPQLVFLDVKMAGLDGLETLSRLRGLDGAAQIVMISGHATIQTAVEATQLGAYEFWRSRSIPTASSSRCATRSRTRELPARTRGFARSREPVSDGRLESRPFSKSGRSSPRSAPRRPAC